MSSRAKATVWAVVALLAACGGEVEQSTDGGVGGAPGGGAPGGGYGGGPIGGYGGGPIGGYGGGPIGGYGGGPIGGYGGGPMGGYGGGPMGGYGGGPDGGYGGTCGANCPGFKLGGLLPMKPCCANGYQCGALVDATLGPLINLPQGCYALGQPGAPDPSCPSMVFTNPIDGKPAQYPGCCRAQSSSCGVVVDLQSKGGPFLGCVDTGAGGASQLCGSSGDPCEQCVQNKCSSEISACFSSPDCSAMLTCMSNCIDQSCVDKCIASYPAGKPQFYDLQLCVSASCGVECG